AGLPVEGKVEKAGKGGYDVRIARQRAFCPFSQIDIIPNTDPASHEGRVYQFRIIEYKDNRNLVVFELGNVDFRLALASDVDERHFGADRDDGALDGLTLLETLRLR
ncbi:MAG TPA: hypothetical protein VEV86_16295, partial [Vicinamibacterales bacterium]|nr:hypothetical protein [Vicinamibacterales bacterium]